MEPKSNLNEEFIDLSDIMSWAIRGKMIERALNKEGMEYIESN